MAPQRARVLITALCVLALFQPVVANDNDPGMPFSVLALIILSFGVICGAFRWPAFHFNCSHAQLLSTSPPIDAAKWIGGLAFLNETDDDED